MAFGRLEQSGTFSYNGVTANETLRSKLTGRMKYDEAGRTVVGITYTLEVEFYLQEPAVGVITDEALDDCWRLLSKPGGKLIFTEKGGGELRVNDEGIWDSEWGPKPKILSWRSAGEAKAAFVTWSCETTLPRCGDARYKGLSEFNFAVQDAIDEAGWTTRTITGHLRIAQTRKTVNARAVEDTADRYRDLALPSVPDGFRLQSQQYTTSKDKSRLDWTVTLKEVPYPLPLGIPVADVDDSIESSVSQGFVNWNRTISGSVRGYPGLPKRTMWRKCLLLILSGLRTRHLPRPDGQAPNITLGKEHTTILWSLKITNHKFTERLSFQATIRVVGPSLVEMLNGSGLFDPLPNTDFRKWKTSLQGRDKPWDARSVAGLKVEDLDDVIVDLCGNERGPVLKGDAVIDRPDGEKKFVPGQNDPMPDENGTWLLFSMSARLGSNWKLSLTKAAQNILPWLPGGAAAQKLVEVAKSVGGTWVTGPAGAVANTIQRVGNAETVVTVKGRAIRIGLPIALPKVEKIGDVEVGEKEDNARIRRRDVKPSTLGKVGGLTIFALTWTEEYLLPREPGEKSPQFFPADPVIQFAPEKDVPKQ